jgi:hypothetical protein
MPHIHGPSDGPIARNRGALRSPADVHTGWERSRSAVCRLQPVHGLWKTMMSWTMARIRQRRTRPRRQARVGPGSAARRRCATPRACRRWRIANHDRRRPTRRRTPPATRSRTAHRASGEAPTRPAAASASGPHAAWCRPRRAKRDHVVTTRRPRNAKTPDVAGVLVSGRYWARTSDLRLVEAALSQLS